MHSHKFDQSAFFMTRFISPWPYYHGLHKHCLVSACDAVITVYNAKIISSSPEKVLPGRGEHCFCRPHTQPETLARLQMIKTTSLLNGMGFALWSLMIKMVMLPSLLSRYKLYYESG